MDAPGRAGRAAADAHGLVHGDVHLANLLWAEPGGLTLLDFEWVRFGPLLPDLARLCEAADHDAPSPATTPTPPCCACWSGPTRTSSTSRTRPNACGRTCRPARSGTSRGSGPARGALPDPLTP
ncbi:hypothetical protein GCM10018963_52080 [Saccharothrix longispora]